MFVVEKVGLFDDGQLLLPFLEIARASLLRRGALLLQLGLAAAFFLSSGWLFG